MSPQLGSHTVGTTSRSTPKSPLDVGSQQRPDTQIPMMIPKHELPLIPTRGFRQQPDAKTPNVARKATGFPTPLLDWSPTSPNFGLGCQTRHLQPHAGDTHPVPAASGHPHHRDPMKTEHPETFLCLWGSPAFAEGGNDVSCKFAGGHRSFNPIRPCAVGAEPSSLSIFYQNLYFLIQFRAKCCRKRGEGDPWDQQQLVHKTSA